MNHTYVLGISAYYHDSAAALLKDGKIVAAAQEERFTRKKQDQAFPTNAVEYCLSEAGIDITKVEAIVFYDKPLLKFERILETYLSFAPKGIVSFITSMPIWLKEKLFLKRTLRKAFTSLGNCSVKDLPELFFSQHHQSHAASAFFSSPFEEAAVLCIDGVGEWASTTVWKGSKNDLSLEWEIDFPHSLGLLYSAFTYYAGFKVNSGEYKLMGLAPYGEPIYVDKIMDNVIDVKPDGTFKLNMQYFSFATGDRMTSEAFNELFEGPPREPEADMRQKDMDIAASIQKVTEEVVLRLAKTIRKEMNVKYLCMAGGVALNCVANGRVLREAGYDDIWIQPAAGDAGGALGAAQVYWYQEKNKERTVISPDAMQGAYLGPEFSKAEVQEYLDSVDANYEVITDKQLFNSRVADVLSEGKVVGWFSGRMEFGPRALCHRSIIGDARNREMQLTMNLKIKYRESFRPFAPVVLEEDVSDYFEIDRPSPYMLLVAPVHKQKRLQLNNEDTNRKGLDKIKAIRSQVPAITHVDYSARVQTLSKQTNPEFHAVMTAFKQKTGSSILVNTSFNVRGEPIVCTPKDAYSCFMNTEMDYLVFDEMILAKTKQPEKNKSRKKFELD
jgi:carbamoyltransferase